MSYYNTDALYGGWDIHNVPGKDEQFVKYLYLRARRISTLRNLPFDVFYEVFRVQWWMDSCAAAGMTKKAAKEGIAELARQAKYLCEQWARQQGAAHPEMAYALCRAVISRNVKTGLPGTASYTNYKLGMRKHRRDLRNRVLPLTAEMRKYMTDPNVSYFGYAGNSQWPYDIRYASMRKRELTPEQRAELKRRLGTKTGYAAAKRREQIEAANQLWTAAAGAPFSGVATRSRLNIGEGQAAQMGMDAGLGAPFTQMGSPLNPMA